MTNLVDSSGWLEFFAGRPNARFFAEPIEDAQSLLVPSICLFEVFTQILRHANEGQALRAIAAMQQGRVVDLDSDIAIRAARLRTEGPLSTGNSIVAATARLNDATLWTQDPELKGIDGVRYRTRKS